MTVIHISLGESPTGDGGLRELQERFGPAIHTTEPIWVSGLAAGMSSGKPSVALGIVLPDGKWVAAETSLAMFLIAADALKAKFGDPRT